MIRKILISFAAIVPLQTSAIAATTDELLARLEALEQKQAQTEKLLQATTTENAALRKVLESRNGAKLRTQSPAGGATGSSLSSSMAMVPLHIKATPLSTSHDWSGIYFGGHVGGLLASSDAALGQTTAGQPFYQSPVPMVMSGAIAGAQIGGNYQINRLVIGAEADLALPIANIKGTDACFTSSYNCSTKIRLLTTLTARVGFAFDNMLVYVKGGGAWQQSQHDVALYNFFNGATQIVNFQPMSTTQRGWTGGVGVEYAFSNNWSGKIEYDYLNFPDLALYFASPGTVPGGFGGLPAPFVGAMQQQNAHIIKTGLNYRFN
jgi:outer membrane immunogenic protein